jgi:hypothetical protein
MCSECIAASFHRIVFNSKSSNVTKVQVGVGFIVHQHFQAIPLAYVMVMGTNLLRALSRRVMMMIMMMIHDT